MKFVKCTARELQQLVVKDGKRVVPVKTMQEIREYVDKQLKNEIWQEEQRFENPHVHHMDMSPAYYQMKMDLLAKMQNAGE